MYTHYNVLFIAWMNINMDILCKIKVDRLCQTVCSTAQVRCK